MGVTAGLGRDGRLWVVYDGGRAGDSAQVAFDLSGYFAADGAGATYHRLGPVRLLDSRFGLGATTPLSSEIPRRFKMVGLYGIPSSTTAVVGTLAVARQTYRGSLALTSAASRPAAASSPTVDFSISDPRPTGVVASLAADGSVWAAYETGRSGDHADVIFDLAGYFAPDSDSLRPIAPYFETFGSFDNSPKDGRGAFMVRYAAPIGLQYNAVHIAQGAIEFFDRWQSGRDAPAEAEADRAVFFNQIDWLVANQLPDGRWLYEFQWGALQMPWWSAMAEGLGISALLRAYSITGDDAYLVAMKRALSTFDRTIENQGVAGSVTVGGNRLTVYEEYLPGYCDNVLNGWVFALASLLEYPEYMGDPAAVNDIAAANRGLAAVRALLPYYDSGSWTFYGLDRLDGPTAGQRRPPGTTACTSGSSDSSTRSPATRP